MRIFTTFLVSLCFPLLSIGQQTINGSITHAGIQRDYILYVPEMYTPESSVPLILNFHGYTSNAFEQLNYGDFRPIADTAGFIVVHPMGTVDLLGNTHWNVGWGTSMVDDLGFTATLIDSLSAAYSIDQDRIYSTGMSNGGFMSYHLACEMSERIAAIASVTGTMNVNQPATCSPGHPMPVMEIHGTADETVPYNGNFLFGTTPAAIAYWVNYNDCESTPAITSIPDTDIGDGCTAEHQVYAGGNNGSTVEHYKIINGEHTWPGSAFGGVGTNQDIDACKEIWRFFSSYDIHGLINTTSVAKDIDPSGINVYPNPASDVMTIEWPGELPIDYTLVALTGQPIQRGTFSHRQNELDLATIVPGIYMLKIENQVIKIVKAE
ncbi:MAG: T9SS type A sorting domain-containing protein [Saprospiraceae bacterium]|nr:T9SS type A sorting domain-containing protein [Saprospiraceae bacterium]